MAFRPNYGRDRAERQRAARARTEEKQRKKDEKAALRKAERDAAQAPPDDKQADDDAEHDSLIKAPKKGKATAAKGKAAAKPRAPKKS